MVGVVETDEQRVVVVVDALRELHKLLDDDKSGCIDSSESKDVSWSYLCTCMCTVLYSRNEDRCV